MEHASDLKRILVLVIFAAVFWVILVLRITQLQLIDRGKYVERAKAQYIQELKLASHRGLIYDRNFNLLAVNQSVYSVGVNVPEVKDVDYAAAQFAELLEGNKTHYLKQLSNGKRFFWLKRGMDEQSVRELEARKVTGLQVVPEMRRFYPQQRLAANLIGFTNVDMKGLSGVELVKDEVLSGNAGLARLQRDALGRPVADRPYQVKEPRSGKNVVLTIDNEIQLSAEDELQRAVQQYQADGGVVLVTNPGTGEILAMAISPTFNPNKPGEFPPEYWRSRAITDNYEPGSTFKPIFMAAVLEEDVKKPDDIIFCENGKYEIYGQTITDVHGYGWLTLRKIISKSSNIGMSKLAQLVKKEVVYQNARAFGFGVRTGIDLSGEVSGELKHTIEWSKSTPLAMSRGYEVSVTPIQMAMAYGAIANGGKLLKPKIFVDEFEAGDAHKINVKPEVIRHVVSDSTCHILVDMLEEVVKNGTGKRAAIPGLRVAGKTGTAWKYNVSRQAYSSTEYYSSFIGFFPVDNPQLLIYVMIDNPQNEYMGGIVAATTFKRIGERVRRILAIENNGEMVPVDHSPDMDRNEKYIVEQKTVVPDVRYKKYKDARALLEQKGLNVRCEQVGQIVIDQRPVAGTPVNGDRIVTLVLSEMDAVDEDSGYRRVPGVIGLSIRDALNRFARENLHVLVQGTGKVVRQSPAAGEKIRPGARCVIECKAPSELAEFAGW